MDTFAERVEGISHHQIWRGCSGKDCGDADQHRSEDEFDADGDHEVPARR